MKKFIIVIIAFILLYTGFVQWQVHWVGRFSPKTFDPIDEKEPSHHLYSFSFTKYASNGEKEIEIEGESADILSQTVSLLNVMAKAYAEEVPVTITSDRGNYDKLANKVRLQKNVVATTENGTRLLTEKLDIYPAKRYVETDIEAQVKKDTINVRGIGARGDSRLKKVKFKKNVTVVVQDPTKQDQRPTIITCDGPLVIDYEKNIAHFKNNVVAEDDRGKLTADQMDVYYNKVTRRVSRIVALGNVMIENPEGNRTYSDSMIYLADEGRVILGGDIEALYAKGDLEDYGGDIF